jgi:hypothetical protein
MRRGRCPQDHRQRHQPPGRHETMTHLTYNFSKDTIESIEVQLQFPQIHTLVAILSEITVYWVAWLSMCPKNESSTAWRSRIAPLASTRPCNLVAG